MNILILADIEAVGEWIATQNMIEEIKKKRTINFYLLAYGRNTFHLQRNLFKKIMLIDKPPLIPPFRYYRQIFLEFINGLRYSSKFKKDCGKIDYIISTEYTLFLPSLIVFPFAKSFFWFHGYKNLYKITLNNFNFYAFLINFSERLAGFISSTIIVPSLWAINEVKKELGLFFYLKQVIIIPNITSDLFEQKYSGKVLTQLKEKLNLQKYHKIILYSGRIDIVKGLENLIKAFILLRKNFKDAALVIAYPELKMDQKLFNNLINVVKTYKIYPHIFFVKNLSRRDLAKIYQISNCAVLPSMREMGSISLLESLMSGLPILSTPVGNAELLLKNTDRSLILKNNSPQIVYKALNKFFSKDAFWHKLLRSKIEVFAKSKLSKSRSIRLFEKLLR